MWFALTFFTTLMAWPGVSIAKGQSYGEVAVGALSSASEVGVSAVSSSLSTESSMTTAERQYRRCRVDSTNRAATATSTGFYGGLQYRLHSVIPMCRGGDEDDKDEEDGFNSNAYMFQFSMDGAPPVTKNISFALSSESQASYSVNLTIPRYGTAVFTVSETPAGTRELSSWLAFQDLPEYTISMCENTVLGAVSDSCEGTDYFPYFFILLVVVPAIVCVCFLLWATYERFGDTIAKAVTDQIREMKQKSSQNEPPQPSAPASEDRGTL